MTSTETEESSVEGILKNAFELFETGSRKIRPCIGNKKVILILGLTGDGKTTLAQWISGNDANLIAKVSSFESVIDGPEIGKSNVYSTTIVPNLFQRNGHNMYDCGGFEDTRGSSHDIATTCLIKKVADDADAIKMVFITGFSAVREGVGGNFLKLLEHITDLVKDINKFRNSIALVVTKVDNIPVRVGEDWIFPDDKTIITEITGFLSKMKQELLESLKSNLGPEKKYKVKAIKIIDIFLTKKEGNFTRIKLFRRPVEPGPLSNNDSYKNAKKDILNTIESLKFEMKSHDDFGYGLAEKTKNDVHYIVSETNKNVESLFKKIALLVEEYFSDYEKTIQEAIESFMAGGSPQQIELSKLRTAIVIIQNLGSKVNTLRGVEETMSTVSENIALLNIDISDDIISDMRKQGQYLNFLQIVSAREFPIRPCNGIFENMLLFLQTLDGNLQKLIEKSIEDIEDQINSALGDLEVAIKNCYTERIQSLGIKSLLRLLSDERYVWRYRTESILHLKNTQFIEAFCNIERDLKISFPDNFVHNVIKIKEFLQYLESLNIKLISMKQTSWLRVSQNLDTFFQKTKDKYEFLTDLYDKLSHYQIQKNKNNCKADWEKSGITNGIEVEAETYNIFLEKISHLSLSSNNTIHNLQFTELQPELNHVLSLTMKNEVKIHSSGTSVMVQGDNISIKDVFHILDTTFNEKRTDTVCLFASKTIFIDKDLIFIGKNLSLVIVAPTWEVIGTRKIDLSGEDEVCFEGGDNEPGENGEPRGPGENGAPGEPGGPGGNFFGIVRIVVNGDNLTVLTNGGRGGEGQRGQNGEDKRDAVLNDDPISYVTEQLPKWCQVGVCAANVASDMKIVKYGSGVLLASSIIIPRLVGAVMEENKYTLDEGGGVGGNGGDGGRGGKGGNPGKIVIRKLNSDLKIECVSEKGEKGTDGEGGTGGHTGMKKVITGNCRDGVFINLEEGGPDGANGERGANDKNIRDADAPPEFPNEDKIVKDYKDFSKESLTDRFKKYHLEKFINLLDKLYRCKRY